VLTLTYATVIRVSPVTDRVHDQEDDSLETQRRLRTREQRDDPPARWAALISLRFAPLTVQSQPRGCNTSERSGAQTLRSVAPGGRLLVAAGDDRHRCGGADAVGAGLAHPQGVLLGAHAARGLDAH